MKSSLAVLLTETKQNEIISMKINYFFAFCELLSQKIVEFILFCKRRMMSMNIFMVFWKITIKLEEVLKSHSRHEELKLFHFHFIKRKSSTSAYSFKFNEVCAKNFFH